MFSQELIENERREASSSLFLIGRLVRAYCITLGTLHVHYMDVWSLMLCFVGYVPLRLWLYACLSCLSVGIVFVFVVVFGTCYVMLLQSCPLVRALNGCSPVRYYFLLSGFLISTHCSYGRYTPYDRIGMSRCELTSGLDHLPYTSDQDGTKIHPSQ